MNLVLFDIDGTLVRTAGAGRDALDTAFAAVFGWPRATEGVYLAGSTDGAILEGVAARRGLRAAELEAEAVAAMWERYFEALAERVVMPGRVVVCAGVFEALERLEGRVHLGLLTGNWARGAYLKLAAVGLAAPFGLGPRGLGPPGTGGDGLDAPVVGAFADDAVDRNHLLPVARRRAAGAGLSYERAFVIGDTPADVACARAGGGVAVAVETGFASPEELAHTRPDLQLPDLVRGGPWLYAALGI